MKEPTASPKLVCYCFNHTVEDIEEEVKRTGSSTLVQDISKKCAQGLSHCEQNNPQGSCCLSDIKKAIEEAKSKLEKVQKNPGSRGGVWNSLAAIPAVMTGFLPAVTCPACWPAYAGLLSVLGLGFLIQDKYLLATMAVFLTVAIAALAISGRKRRAYGPVSMGVVGGIIMLVGKFMLEMDLVMYGGIGLLISASIWNVWPLRKRKAGGAGGAGGGRGGPGAGECGSCCQTK